MSGNTATTINISNSDNTAEYEVIYAYPPEIGTKPSIEVTYANNFKAQVEGNTKAVAANNKTLVDFVAYQNAVNLGFDMRITALEP